VTSIKEQRMAEVRYQAELKQLEKLKKELKWRKKKNDVENVNERMRKVSPSYEKSHKTTTIYPCQQHHNHNMRWTKTQNVNLYIDMRHYIYHDIRIIRWTYPSCYRHFGVSSRSSRQLGFCKHFRPNNLPSTSNIMRDETNKAGAVTTAFS
jgi:hypothetical protein